MTFQGFHTTFDFSLISQRFQLGQDKRKISWAFWNRVSQAQYLVTAKLATWPQHTVSLTMRWGSTALGSPSSPFSLVQRKRTWGGGHPVQAYLSCNKYNVTAHHRCATFTWLDAMLVGTLGLWSKDRSSLLAIPFWWSDVSVSTCDFLVAYNTIHTLGHFIFG